MRMALRYTIKNIMAVTAYLAAQVVSATNVSSSSVTHEQLSGVWQIESPVFAVHTTTGDLPPLQEPAGRIYQKHIAERKQGDTSFDGATWCASVGMPRLMFINSPFEIMIGPRHIAFMHEWNWWARVIYLKGGLTANATSDVDQPTT